MKRIAVQDAIQEVLMVSDPEIPQKSSSLPGYAPAYDCHGGAALIPFETGTLRTTIVHKISCNHRTKFEQLQVESLTCCLNTIRVLMLS